MIKRITGTAVTALIVAVAAGSPAIASGIQDDAVAELNQDHVYSTDNNFNENEVEQGVAASGESVGVVAINDYDMNTFSATDIGNFILPETPYETIIVSIDGNGALYVSSNVNAVAKAELVNQAYAQTGDKETAIIQGVNGFSEISGTPAEVPGGNGTTEPIEGVEGVFLIIALVCVSIMAVTAGIVVWGVTRKRAVSSKIDKTVPKDVSQLLLELTKLIQESNGMPKHTEANIRKVRLHVEDLFKRLNKKGSEGQIRIVNVEYQDKLEKIVSALGEDYYLDIYRNPHLWDNAQGRMKEVEDALEFVEKQVVENIKQVNASEDLKFTVAINSLIREKGKTSVDSIYTEKPEKTRKQQF